MGTAGQALTRRGANSMHVRKAMGAKKKAPVIEISESMQTLVLRTTAAVLQEESRPDASHEFLPRRGK